VGGGGRKQLGGSYKGGGQRSAPLLTPPTKARFWNRPGGAASVLQIFSLGVDVEGKRGKGWGGRCRGGGTQWERANPQGRGGGGGRAERWSFSLVLGRAFCQILV